MCLPCLVALQVLLLLRPLLLFQPQAEAFQLFAPAQSCWRAPMTRSRLSRRSRAGSSNVSLSRSSMTSATAIHRRSHRHTGYQGSIRQRCCLHCHALVSSTNVNVFRRAREGVGQTKLNVIGVCRDTSVASATDIRHRRHRRTGHPPGGMRTSFQPVKNVNHSCIVH